MRPACPRLFEVEAMRDGRLTDPELAAFGRHTTTCRACRYEARTLEELARAVRAGDQPADELRVARGRARLLADFDRFRVASSGRRWRPAHRLVWPAVAVVVACALFVTRPPRPSAPMADHASATVHPESGSVWSTSAEGDAQKIVLAQGTLTIHVDHGSSRRSRLIVSLPDGDLEDVGTTFTVTVDGRQTRRVAVQEGSVLLRIRGGAIAINAGQAWTSQAPTGPTAAGAPPSESTGPATGPVSHRPLPLHAPKAPAHSPPVADEAPRSGEFRAAVRLLERGDGCQAAAGFARYAALYPEDPHAEDAGYLRVIALQRCGSGGDVQRAALEFLRRYPSAFRRAEVEQLSRQR